MAIFLLKEENAVMEKDQLLKMFGERVHHFRKLHGMTQSVLAEAAELTIEQISKIERGKSRTRIETAQRIAHALKVDLYQLFVFSEISTKPENKLLNQLADELSSLDDSVLEYLLPIIEGAKKLSGK